VSNIERPQWHDDPEAYAEGYVARRIVRTVEGMWQRMRGHQDIVDDESQAHFIRAKRRAYPFPDYLALVGPPSPEDYASPGELTLARKAQLLLLGTFYWQGLTLGTHRSVFGYDRYGYAAWSADDKGWYVAQEEFTPRFTYEGFFSPMLDVKSEPLSHYLFAQNHTLKAGQGVLYRNTNPYDNRPDNLATYSLKGRPMRCLSCQQRVHPKDSERFKVGNSYRRHCFRCLRDMDGAVALNNNA